jgi:hypothetical protein
VEERCTCGAVLPPDARFCHKCGKPLRAEDVPVIEETAPVPAPAAATAAEPPKKTRINFHNSIAVRVAFVAAGLSTLLAMVPFPIPMGISALWQVVILVAGGFYATYQYSRRTGESLSVSAGARMGWLTGIFAFVIVTVVTTISMVALSTNDGARSAFRKMAENSPAAESIDKLLQSDAGLAAFLLVGLAGTFLMWTVLAVLGGALGAKVLEKD